jgi:hypothetical protein
VSEDRSRLTFDRKRILVNFLALILLITSTSNFSTQPTHANEYSCLFPPEIVTELWETSEARDLKFLVSWSIKDPEFCVEGITGSPVFKWDNSIEMATTSRLTRVGEMVLVTAEFEFPTELLMALPNNGSIKSDVNFLGTNENLSASIFIKIKQGKGSNVLGVVARKSLRYLWASWFSKQQGISNSNCTPQAKGRNLGFESEILEPKIDYKILEYGVKPRVQLNLSEKSNCIFLIHSGPIEKVKNSTFSFDKTFQTLAEYPFWENEASSFFKSISSSPNQIINVGEGDFAFRDADTHNISSGWLMNADPSIFKEFPKQILKHADTVRRDGSNVVIETTLDAANLSYTESKYLTFYVGFYFWYHAEGISVPSGWRITFSGNSWSANYSRGGGSSSGYQPHYSSRAIKIPISEIILSPLERQAIAEKAAADLKAKQDADRAAADLKAKQDADAKAAATKKMTTITCIKGKSNKKVTAIKPKCPTGYKKK